MPQPPLRNNPDRMTRAHRRDAVLLVQQLCVMGKNIQLPARMALFRTIVERGILHALQWGLAEGMASNDQQLLSTTGEVLSTLIEHDTIGTRAHILRQVQAGIQLTKQKEEN